MSSEAEERAWIAMKEGQWRELFKTITFSLVVFTATIFYSIYSFWYNPLFTFQMLAMLSILYIVSGCGYLAYRRWKGR